MVVMPVRVEDIVGSVSAERQAKIKDRTAQLIAEEMTLQQMRKARKITQAKLARKLKIKQNGVSRLEQRGDMMLGTLRKTVEAMGGSLSLIVKFPDQNPVLLAGFNTGDSTRKT